MEKTVEIRVKKMKIQHYVEDIIDFTFGNPTATNAKIYIRFPEYKLTEKPNLDNAIPFITWVYDKDDKHYITTLYLTNNAMIKEVVVFNKVYFDECAKRKRKGTFYLEYKETIYYEIELP
jgi:hypothetical protein